MIGILMYELGIIGGMGPLSTVEFMRRIVDYTQAQRDQEHINMCVLNRSSIPDRMEYLIAKDGESPLPYITQCLHQLIDFGVKTIAIPCNTSHVFVDEMVFPENVNFVNMIEETIIAIKKIFPNKMICVLGTTGTQIAGIYDQYVDIYLDISQLFYPEEKEQAFLMEIIYQLKAGHVDESINDMFINLLNKIAKSRAETVFIIACTELSLINKKLLNGFSYVDALDILAVKAIQACGYNNKNEYLPILL